MVNVDYQNIQFENDIPEAIYKFPELQIKISDGIKFLSGNIFLTDADGKNCDTYDIEIYPSEFYPYRFPYVFEIGGKIPKNVDWHVFEQNGNCCIKVIPEEKAICFDGLSLSNFIESQLLPYLFNQTYRRKKGYFLNERSHGVIGIYEFYSEILKETDLYKIIKLLSIIKSMNEPNRRENCFCGSKNKYRYCHRVAYRTLLKVGTDQMENDISALDKLLMASLYHMQQLIG